MYHTINKCISYVRVGWVVSDRTFRCHLRRLHEASFRNARVTRLARRALLHCFCLSWSAIAAHMQHTGQLQLTTTRVGSSAQTSRNSNFTIEPPGYAVFAVCGSVDCAVRLVGCEGQTVPGRDRNFVFGQRVVVGEILRLHREQVCSSLVPLVHRAAGRPWDLCALLPWPKTFSPRNQVLLMAIPVPFSTTAAGAARQARAQVRCHRAGHLDSAACVWRPRQAFVLSAAGV